MYRQNLNILDDIKLTLMQTSKKELCEIPIEYVDDIPINWDDMSELNLTIPSIINKDGIQKENLLYNKIKGKTQQIILSNPPIRFIINDIQIKEEKIPGSDIIYKTKSINCKSFESTLTEKLVLNEDTLFELWNEDNNGILNLFEEYNKNWKVEYISDKALYETGIARKEEAISVSENFNNKVNRDILIWEYLKPINVYNDKTYIGLKIKYKNVITKFNNVVQSTLDFTHTIDEIHTSITSIRAYYSKYDADYCIKYIISLADGIEKTEYKTFTFCDNMDVEIENVELIYSDGEEVESTYIRRRNIEEGEYTWLDILRDNISNGYDGLYIEFNTISKTISVYNREEYGEHHGLQFSYKNYVQAINKNIVGDDIMTKVRVTNSNGGISSVNKFGGDFIYDYSYAYNNDIMSDELKEAYDEYMTFVNNNQENITVYREEKATFNKELIKLESERTAIDYDIQNLQVAQSVLFSEQAEKNVDMSKEIEEYHNKIKERQERFAEVMRLIQELNDKIALLSSNINSLQEKYNFETCGFFNEEMLEELYDLTIYKEINDDSFGTIKELYENYLYLTYIKNNQGVEFAIDSVGFIENIIIPSGLTWDYMIEMGSFVDLEEVNDIDINERGLRIISYTLDPKNNSISNITLTNRDRKVDLLSGFTKLKEVARRTENFVNNNKNTWNKSKITNKNVSDIVNNGIDTSKININGDSLKQNKAGLFTLNATDNNSLAIAKSMALNNKIPNEVIYKDKKNDIYIGRGIVAISKDNWKSCETAITGDRVNGDVIKGSLFLGNELIITGEKGNFCIGNIDSINGDKTNSLGLKISNQDGKDMIFLGIDKSSGVPVAKLEMFDDKGELTFSNESRVSEIQYVKEDAVDIDKPMNCEIRLRGNVKKIEEAILSIRFKEFEVYSKGMEGAGGGNISLEGANASINIVGKKTGTTKDKRQTLLKATGNTKEIAEFSELEEYQFVVDKETGELASIYLPKIQLTSESTATENYIYSFDTDEHSHEINVQLDNVEMDGEIAIDNHIHTELHGVFIEDNALPSNVSVYINNQLVAEEIEDDIEIDITEFIPSVEGLHNITLHSDTRGILSVNVYVRSMTRWR